MFNSTGVLLNKNGSQVSANFDGTVTISVIALSNILHASSSLSVEYRNHTEGLLGKKQSADYTKAAALPMGLGLPCPAQLFLSPQGHREGLFHTLFKLISCLPFFFKGYEGDAMGKVKAQLSLSSPPPPYISCC